jgi:hypothetical protein
MKKIYTTPRLTVHGSVEKITLASPGGQQNNNANPNDGVYNPGHACDRGQAAFCVS